MLKHALALAVPALIASTLAPSNAHAAVLFQDNFQSTALKYQWSTNSKVYIQAEQTFTWFSGRYTNETISLSLPSAPPPPKSGSDNNGGGKYNLYTLTFDLFVIDSWDGLDPVLGQDRFLVNANSAPIFNEAFANVHDGQTFRRPDVGPTQLGFNTAYNDSIYRKIAVNFTIPDNQSISLSFHGTANQGLNDESWGMDNVSVSYQVVPAPGALGLASLGGLLLLKRRQR